MAQEQADPAEFIRPNHVRARFGITPSTAYRWAREGRLEIIRHGNCSFIRISDLQAVITGKGPAHGQTEETA